ncbi:ABC transporter substrate-binding protein [Allobranchiibius huperziae]|uniref:Peptide/nickel transport system substrate-binding protein n=1 Tax=Allobranchiibius huperziae TaxID=1874116 RepID=A0A853DEQ1_9MICO|nr:ABC transporter substrate-binding protein [Allobranchiibius huperziae]NYJ74449.1 peptide/nickel transport system substrate-binding protein [Allobranchiibius huperziae]
MLRANKSLTLVGVSVVGAALALSACGGGGSTKNGGTSTKKGGTLTYQYAGSPVTSWDPQNSYIGVDLTNESRLFSRSLVQLSTTNTAAAAAKPVPDLATNTGTSSNGAKTWKFTLKSGVKWQDGSAVTCDDVKYGAERSFAPAAAGGPTYAKTYLGLSKYAGPGTAGQSDFDKQVTCSGNTITYNFKLAWPDFPLAIASLREFDPYKKSQDKGTKSNYTVFSDGPYKLQGSWVTGTGGTFVRNPEYSASTDGVRKALPDKIIFKDNTNQVTTISSLIQDNPADQAAVTYINVPSASFSQTTGANVKDRVDNVGTTYIDYLQPNMKRMTNPKVRQALAMATDQNAYIKALGGSAYGTAAYSLLNPTVTGYQLNSTFKSEITGNAAAAKKILQSAGVPMPYPIKYTYSNNTANATSQAQALAATWDQAGFKVTLNAVSAHYYPTIRTPSDNSDVYWASWSQDWAAASTILPPLFDARINLSSSSKSSDYGSYSSNTVNSLFDKAAQQTSQSAAASVYNEADTQLAKDLAYIPLAQRKFVLVYGSKVTNFQAGPVTASYPDLGVIGVKQ